MLRESPVSVIDLGREKGELYHRDFIMYKDAKGGVHKAEHPVIMDGLKLSTTGIIEPESNEKIQVGLDGNIEEMSFEDYLFMMGIKYGHYYKEAKDPKNDGADSNELIKQLHQAVIEQRTKTTRRLRKKQNIDRDQKRSGSAVGSVVLSSSRQEVIQSDIEDDSKFFIKMFKDLGIDGLDAQAPLAREDILDEVDEYLVLDRTAYETEGEEEGEKIFIGIQRSSREKELTSKFISSPESPDKGLIFKILLQEDEFQYRNANNDSLWQELLSARTTKAREAGMNPLAYAEKYPASEGIPPVSEVLRGGQQEHIRRVVKVLQAIQKQIEHMMKEPDHHFHGMSPYWQEKFREKFGNLPIQEIIDELKGE